VLSTVFLLLHTVGSHYTYSHVPLGEWVRELFALSRNHYDRLVHFSFGLLLLLPNLELALGPAPGRRPWVHYYLAFATIAWWSVFYELLEWLTAHVVDPAAGTAFLGTQGDAWDSQQDMAVACIGAAAAVAIEWFRTAVPTPPR
jgi:putative membrane protein